MFFFDGSSNQAAAAKDIIPTNVFRLNRAVTYGFSGVPQIAFYFAGVGTRRDYASAATGRGFDEIVIEAYVNLASNYMPGDQIYLFGFSRGAAAARALSELISKPGLLPADNLDVFPELWKCFVESDLGDAKLQSLTSKFKSRLHSDQPRIRFLGAFDAVAGSSWDRFNVFGKVRFRNSTLDPSVDHAVHLLAIDDNRNPSFSPLLWEGTSERTQILEQIWMPGVHADIGGCSDGRFLGDVALLTMMERIQQYCPEVEIDEGYLQKEVVSNVRSARRVEISDERPGILRKLLRGGPRAIGRQGGEYIHSIFGQLLNRQFAIRGEQKRYCPENYRKALSVAATELDDELQNIVKRLTRQ
ncbi:DUF2235 domain-containing protein [Bradyrhizobium sp. 186]|uniref:T6SS phospholipase effector Tle1-like catalytic domain-containing protein n=1 Tax=Bradyrhizobium sp. 186 TaxID=2782654 RepID=UPI0020007E7D|nr:DUF2235 domain-containing protein [Bradyrhizobium sp. 186]UPK35145.1 DUF2235 domain-containing protein [Bradyrhizobium sp. 186]